ncbi:hypothetical protein, partial [Citrobacter telavivensis]|uniref:hypothetical protein n=1 Tax=Citrobacter telavivensis TaxID=2653932 RepID=UPI001A908552
VLGLPPAFNLSHDQTLQFKFDARRIKLRNELRVHSLRLGIHLVSEDIKNPCHFECPHRLSDKLLKSSAASLFFSAARGVHNTLSRFRVKHLFRFSLWVFISEPR